MQPVLRPADVNKINGWCYAGPNPQWRKMPENGEPEALKISLFESVLVNSSKMEAARSMFSGALNSTDRRLFVSSVRGTDLKLKAFEASHRVAGEMHYNIPDGESL